MITKTSVVLVGVGLLGAGIFTACTVSTSSVAEPDDPTPNAANTALPGPTASRADDRACTTDDDCEVVETACCDHCNGGKVDAFAKTHAAEHKPTGCEGKMCTQRGCGAAVAKCNAGQCAAEIQPLGS